VPHDPEPGAHDAHVAHVGHGAGHETYTHGHDESVLRSHRWRTAENSAAYLLPRLRAGQRMLDVGCGPGTITVDLASRVAPGEVVGIDREPAILREAEDVAREAGATNVRFEVGDTYHLDFPDGAFDVVHVHQVMHHLADPVAALVELRRVCAPDGVVAVRETDFGGMTWYPEVPELDEWMALFQAVTRANGGEPDAGRRLLGWAQAAGFSRVEPSASVWCFATPEDRAWWAGSWAERTVGPGLGEGARAQGRADRGDLERIAAGWRVWEAAVDGWCSVLHGEVLGTP